MKEERGKNLCVLSGLRGKLIIALEESQYHRAEACEGDKWEEQEPSQKGNGGRKGENDRSPE